MIHALKIQQYQTITSAFQEELAQVAGRTNVRGHVTAPAHGSNSTLENTSRRENLIILLVKRIFISESEYVPGYSLAALDVSCSKFKTGTLK